MTSFEISTLRSIYITNQFHQYPMPWLKKKTVGTGSNQVQSADFCTVINTGWHILPNFLWGHVASPKQWHEMVMKFQSIKVTGITCRLFNPIPIQSAVSFQGNAVFPAFNNTVYAMTYTDDEYETPWFDWWAKIVVTGAETVDLYYEYNPGYKEGVVPRPRTQEFPQANEAADDLGKYENDGCEWYPKYIPTKIFQANEINLMEYNQYRRQFLPIYWYHFTYKNYQNSYAVSADWEALSTNHEMAFADPSGIFWDPLNRPSELGELRPGKNMVEYKWNVHEVDSGIWFNTDRIGFLTPYGRPRPLQPPASFWNLPMQPRDIDPRGPGYTFNKYQFLKQMGLVRAGEPRTTAGNVMAPEGHMNLPDWRRWPIVPSQWFYEELRESNPYAYNNISWDMYRTPGVSGNNNMATNEGCGTEGKAGDTQLIGPCQNIRHAGTEYEQHKYPPTQWFIKGVPLMDGEEKRIPVELQMWMHITVHLQGKERKSALYAPSWGPYDPIDLYSINMDSKFGENYMRGRSGGARRTWYNPSDGIPEKEPFPKPKIGELFQSDSSKCTEKAYPFDIETIHTHGSKLRGITERHFPYTRTVCNKRCNETTTVKIDTKSMERCVSIKEGCK